MAKEKEEKKDAAADKADLTPEEAAAKAKKRKLLIVVVGGVVLTAGIGGGLAFFLSGGSGDQMAAKTPAEHGEEVKAEGHGDEKKAEGHGDEKKAEGHGDEKKAEGHGDEKKAEGHGDEKKADAKDGDGKKLALADGVDFGCTQTLKPFHLNLGNPLENRYIRLELAIEFSCAEETKAEIERRLPQLQDAIIAVTTRKTREFLLGPDGKEQLRKEIHTRINHYMTSKVDDVFITDILIE